VTDDYNERHFQRRPLPQIALDRIAKIKAIGEYAVIPSATLARLVPLQTKLFAEETMHGDEMRDAAQLLDYILDSAVT